MKDGGTIDIDDGKVKVRFMAELRKDLGLAYRPEHWTEAKLAAWICRNLPDPYTTHSSKNAFVSAWIGKLLMQEGYDPRIGDFDSKEEYLCACELEKWAARGRIDFWVRNLVRKPCSSFFLQSAEGRFYPDFVCRLPDKTILVVEYKGGDRYAGAKPDRDMGGLWAELSGGRCRFVMVTEKKWGVIEAKL